MSWTGAIFDLTIIGWLMWRRTRMWAFLVAGVFHLLTWLLFPQIGVFPWLMLGGALIFFPPDWPKGLVVWVRTAGKAAGPRAAPELGQPAAREARAWLPRAAGVVIVIFFLLQLAVPLRHYFYPGKRALERGGLQVLLARPGHREGRYGRISGP